MVPQETLIWGRFHNWLSTQINLQVPPQETLAVYKFLVMLDLDLMGTFVVFCATGDPECARKVSCFLSWQDEDREERTKFLREWKERTGEELGSPAGDIPFVDALTIGDRHNLLLGGGLQHSCPAYTAFLYSMVPYSHWVPGDGTRIKEIMTKAKAMLHILTLKMGLGEPDDLGCWLTDYKKEELPEEIREHAWTLATGIPIALCKGDVEISVSPFTCWQEPYTSLTILFDPRLPDSLWRYYRERLHEKFIVRNDLLKLFRDKVNKDNDKTNKYGFIYSIDAEYPVLYVEVLDEREFFAKHFEKDKQKAARKTWEKIREEILRAGLSEDKELRPLYVAFCEHAKLEIIEKQVQNADLLCSQGKYDAAVALCRQVAETLFKLMTGEPEETPVYSKRIRDRKDDISGTYGERVFYDLANVWKDGSKLVHHPEANEAEMRYKARDVVGRTTHLWNMFKQRHFEYYGLPITWQSSTEGE